MENDSCSSFWTSFFILLCACSSLSGLLGPVLPVPVNASVPRSKCSLAKLSCCSRILVICSMVEPDPNAFSLPEWKSSSSPSSARSMCRTSGTSDMKE
uniref:Putative secreted peptide n=1 Tax=Anopheles braziliensis TaxID=58242 RepID=A0A2M3ZS89_9DIPT